MSKKSLDIRFEEAIAKALEISQSDLPQDVQLRCYAYYKQATSNYANKSYSDNFDLRNAFKTNALMQISHLSVSQAKELYIETILSLSKK